MKLAYLYLFDNPPFKDAEFNFDSDVHFAFDGKELKIVSMDSVIPDHFFSASGSSNVVQGIPAIVGDNGSGKTTLAKVMAEIFAGNPNGYDYIAVMAGIAKDSRFDVYWHGRQQIRVSAAVANSEHVHETPKDYFKEDLRFNVEMAYFSPLYTTQRKFYPDVGDNIYDCSTTAKILEVQERFLNKSPEDEGSIRQTVAYEFDETCNVLNLLKRMQEANFGVDSRRVEPVGCYAQYNTSVAEVNLVRYQNLLRRMENSLTGLSGQEGYVKEETKRVTRAIARYKRAVKVLKMDKAFDPFVSVFLCYAGCYWSDNNISFSNEKPFALYPRRLLVFSWVLLRNLDKAHQQIHEFFDRAIERLDEDGIKEAKKAKAFFSKLESVWQTTDPPIRGMDFLFAASVDRPGTMDLLLDLAKMHAETMQLTSFMVFRILPPMSTGEMAYLNLWSRLLKFFDAKESEWANLGRDKSYQVVLFLDEAETSLHPKWQQALVWNLIRFLERFAPNANVQIFLGTHSPMLLSDVPIGNSVFLERNNGEPTSVHKASALKICNTFGANIFDLYHESFFMREGSVGLFANEKLKMLREWVLGSERDRQVFRVPQKDVAKVANLIGDEFVGPYFRERCLR